MSAAKNAALLILGTLNGAFSVASWWITANHSGDGTAWNLFVIPGVATVLLFVGFLAVMFIDVLSARRSHD